MQITSDDVWVPSYNELFESNGLYHGVFPNNASCIKQKSGNTPTSAWWLRSAHSSSYSFRCVTSSGGWDSSRAYNSNGVALGFCLN